MESQSKPKLKPEKILFYAVVFFVVLLGIFTLIMSHMAAPSDHVGEYTKADLGTIGDFIGGILNPIFGFATVCLLVWSIRIQHRELNAATTEFRQTKEIHQQNVINEEKNFQSKMIWNLYQKLRTL